MASAAPEIPVLARDQAFETIYRRYAKDVYHYALALLRNPADAEDVTQTTFMNAYRAYKRGDEILTPQHWLIKIAHNVARTRYARASRRVKEVPLEDHVEQLAVPEDERPNVEGVLRALGRLPFNQRAAIVMRELEGRSYVEIADTLDVSVAAVETLIFRARRSLRMRSDALRSLAVVPLPGSLTQLFGSGGVVAGGTAVGSGFVVKAAVALLAGAFVTGIGSERSRPAEAAAKSAAPGISSSGWSLAVPTALRQAGSIGPATRSKTKARTERDRTVAVTPKGSHTTTSTAGQATTSEGTKSSPLTTTVAKATQPVKDVVDTVTDTVDTAVSTVPEVEIPPLPPVEVPSPPPLPPLPPVPTLP